MIQALQTNVRLQIQEPQSKYVTAKDVPRLFFLVSVMSISTFSCGYMIAYIVALGVKNLKIVYGETAVIPVARGFLIATLPFGISFGSFIGPWVIAQATRRNLTLILSGCLLILYGIIQIPRLPAFYIVRFFQGTIVGIYLILIPMYIKEITPRQISAKPLFGIFQKLFLLFGFVVPFGFNVIMIETHLDQFIRWRIIVTANALSTLVVVFFILIGVIPQSPISLIEKQKQEQAKRVISMFHKRSCVEQIYKQKLKQAKLLQMIQKHIGHGPKKSCKLRTFLTFEVPIVHQLTGVNAYISQMGVVTSPYNLGFSYYVPFLMTTVQLLTLMLSAIYIQKATPRQIILVGNVGMSLCCFGIGTSLILVDSFYWAFWTTITCIILFMGFNGATFLPAAGIYVAEVGTRKHVRWSLISNWFASASSVVLFVTIGSKVGYAAVFFGFGVITLIGFVFNLGWMMETKVRQTCPNIELKTRKKQESKQAIKKHDTQQTDFRGDHNHNSVPIHALTTRDTL